MFGILGTVIFGIIFSTAWINGEQSEQKNRNSAIKNNNDIYVDKWGKLRHSNTGKKYTTVESKQNIKKENRRYIINKYNSYKNLINYIQNTFHEERELLSFEEWFKKTYGYDIKDDFLWNM